MKQTTIDATLLPNVWIYWTNTQGRFWLECSTGKKKIEKPDVNFLWSNREDICVNRYSKPMWAYVKYHEDIDMLEIAAATIDTTSKETVHEWKYAGNKYFIDKAKNVYDENGNTQHSRFHLYQWHDSVEFKQILSYLHRLSAHPKIIGEFHKFLGGNSYTNGHGNSIEAKYTWHIYDWYVKKQKTYSKGKEQKLVDKLIEIPLSDVSNLSATYPVKKTEGKTRYYYSARQYIAGLIYYERLTDGWSVLRMFYRNNDGTNFREVERMYLNDNGKNRIATPTKNGWTTAKQSKQWNHYYQFVNKNEAMEKCNRLKYILPLFDDDEAAIRECLITALRFPEIEQMMKLGHKDFAKIIAKSDCPKADMMHWFGDYYNEKETNLLRKVGLTKHQFDKHMDESSRYKEYREKSLKDMRELFGKDFAHLDNNTFDTYYDAFVTINQNIYGGFKRHCDILHLDYKRFMKNIIRIAKKDNGLYTMARDTMQMYYRLPEHNQPEIDWYFDSASDVNRAHDAVMALELQARAERQAYLSMAEAERRKKEEEKRKKLDEERKKYEYEDNNFIIRLPKDGNEIITEGNKQRICIGGYVGRHSNGETNLFFIRKKSDPETPFYAIEMRHSNIVQIHGYCNRWLGNNPEAIPTVVRWLRKNGIKCTKQILTCTSTGYCQNNQYCPMPVVD